jgi:5-methylcytosine-specific restriction endonuclease McrA
MANKPVRLSELRGDAKVSRQTYDAAHPERTQGEPRRTYRWRKLRATVLAAEPLCRDIYGLHRAVGRAEPATQVDHIKGVRAFPDLAYAMDNLQPLCTGCHGRKSAEERKQGA